MKNALFAEEKLVDAQALTNISAQTTNFVDLKKGHRVAFVIALAASATAATVEFKLQQRVGTGAAKDLAINKPYYVKVAGATSFTKYELPLEETVVNYEIPALATAAGVVIVEVLAEDLDVNGDYDQVGIVFETSTNAKAATIVTVVEPKELPAYKA